ncbi:MAG TPA: carboxymuconolactone decarboxylase family protein [Candidatus Diapherotrites archaeon]|uniref:Carboxymuconolactone decarboxylase family protein n=1 Tax=Candidatus Iainarchaeum sp. TaxID=3101447 RepID=A0A7J4KUR9_9ARCH|nr:carboxymuconolactone decarboxylase family protein [Candidatus Diapherotrites archaeon]
MERTETMQVSKAMTKEETFKEMKETFGMVPSFFKKIPESAVGLEWQLMKIAEMEPGVIPQKYRELIGLGISAATKCQYCALFHTEMAKLQGATEEEIEEAARYAKSNAGWSTYLHGMQTDYDQFKKEIIQMTGYARTMHSKR